ncbi:MAG TPA: hypothetical protein VMK12_25860 [Anaeromyxobacteraceae bacterium]|nr:hypothetical protein [Anaeromyxobacteraceae bacterium]
MKLPWLQMEREAFTKAELLAGMLDGPSYNEVLGMLVRLWRLCLSTGRSEEPPTGLIESPRAARLVAVALDWAGPEAKLVEAMADAGFLEVLPTGLRIKGASRYGSHWRRNHNLKSSEGLEAAAQSPRRDRTATDAQTKTKTKKRSPPPTPSGGGEGGEVNGKAQGEGQEQLLSEVGEQLCAAYGAAFRQPYTVEAKDRRALEKLLFEFRVPPNVLLEVWAYALQSKGFPKTRSIPGLARNWNDLLAEATQRGGNGYRYGYDPVDRPRPR